MGRLVATCCGAEREIVAEGAGAQLGHFWPLLSDGKQTHASLPSRAVQLAPYLWPSFAQQAPLSKTASGSCCGACHRLAQACRVKPGGIWLGRYARQLGRHKCFPMNGPTFLFIFLFFLKISPGLPHLQIGSPEIFQRRRFLASRHPIPAVIQLILKSPLP